jgi:hypothetical protein
MRFLRWCRASFGLNRLSDIDVCAEELTCTYLEERIARRYSPWTLATERSALRLFFGQRNLAASIVLPARTTSAISRSRHPAMRDRHLNPDHWQHLIAFTQACGLRREELRDLRVSDVYHRVSDGLLVVQVRRGKGGKWREAPVLVGCEAQILPLIIGRHAEERVFTHLPVHLDVQASRRFYAQRLYEQYAGRPLPSSGGPLHATEVDREAASQVSRALGHERLDIVLLYYLR